MAKRPDLSVQLCGFTWKTPLTTASGTMGGWDNYEEVMPLHAFGALTVKSVTLEERLGNPPPRLAETPCGMLNTIGLPNPGIDRWLETEWPRVQKYGLPVIVSIAGRRRSDYVELARRLDRVSGIAAIELNMSCPNTDRETMEFGQVPEEAYRLVREVRDATRLPLIAKLTPNVADPVPIAQACLEAGADALSIANTLLAMAIDIHTQLPKTGTVFAGLSGPAIRPVIVRMVWQVHAAFPEVPIIGMGGVMTWEDAVEYFLAGASAVALGTVNFIHPRAPLDILQGLEAYLVRHGLGSVRELIGLAHVRWRESRPAERLHA